MTLLRTLEIVIRLDMYGALHRREAKLLHLAGTAHHLDVFCDIAAALHAEYTA